MPCRPASVRLTIPILTVSTCQAKPLLLDYPSHPAPPRLAMPFRLIPPQAILDIPDCSSLYFSTGQAEPPHAASTSPALPTHAHLTGRATPLRASSTDHTRPGPATPRLFDRPCLLLPCPFDSPRQTAPNPTCSTNRPAPDPLSPILFDRPPRSGTAHSSSTSQAHPIRSLSTRHTTPR